jgi:hypothetical protein
MRQRLSCRIDQKLRVLGMLIVKPDIALILAEAPAAGAPKITQQNDIRLRTCTCGGVSSV